MPGLLTNVLIPLLCRLSLSMSSSLKGIPEEEEVQDDAFLPLQHTPSTASLVPNPESSFPLIGKVFLFFAKKDSLASLQGSES